MSHTIIRYDIISGPRHAPGRQEAHRQARGHHPQGPGGDPNTIHTANDNDSNKHKIVRR